MAVLAARWKRWRGSRLLASQLSLLAPSPLFFLTLRWMGGGGQSKEMGFHGRLKAAIKLAAFSKKTIRHFDAVIVCCMIYDWERKSLFMFFFSFSSFILCPWIGLAAWQFFFHKYLNEFRCTSGAIGNLLDLQSVVFLFFGKCLSRSFYSYQWTSWYLFSKKI